MNYTVQVNEHLAYQLSEQSGKLSVDGQELEIDRADMGPGLFHLIYKNRSYTVEVISMDRESKTCEVKVNTNRYRLSIKDQFDALLHQLGMDNLNVAKVSEIRAPMPGLVLKVLVAEGQEVKKGDALIVLEAMKMENIIKAPADAKIRQVPVKSSDKVEKNQVLIRLE